MYLLCVNLVFIEVFLYDCGRTLQVRAWWSWRRIAPDYNRGTNGRNTFSYDVLLSNTDTKMLVIRSPGDKFLEFRGNLRFKSLTKKRLKCCAHRFTQRIKEAVGRERKESELPNNTSSGRRGVVDVWYDWLILRITIYWWSITWFIINWS